MSEVELFSYETRPHAHRSRAASIETSATFKPTKIAFAAARRAAIRNRRCYQAR